MHTTNQAGTHKLGDREVKRLGYGAMQLAGPGVFGPPKDHHAALAVLREAVAAGVDHIDTGEEAQPRSAMAFSKMAAGRLRRFQERGR